MKKENENVENIEEVVTNEETTEMAVVDDPKQKGAEIGKKIADGAKKAWNSKPMKVVKTVGLIGIGVIGGLCLGKAAAKDGNSSNGSDETLDDFITVDIDKEVPDKE